MSNYTYTKQLEALCKKMFIAGGLREEDAALVARDLVAADSGSVVLAQSPDAIERIG